MKATSSRLYYPRVKQLRNHEAAAAATAPPRRRGRCGTSLAHQSRPAEVKGRRQAAVLGDLDLTRKHG